MVSVGLLGTCSDTKKTPVIVGRSRLDSQPPVPGALRQEEVPLRKIPADVQRDSLSRGSIKVTDREGLWLSLENDFKIKGKRAGREEFPRARL